MQLELLLIALAIVTFIVFYILQKNNPTLRKYWKYALILIPGVIMLILKMMTTKADDKEEAEELEKKMNGLKDDLTEAQQTAAIEVSAAKEKNKTKLDELKKVTKIKDSKERRQRLADMMD